jgi:hypothetical protein
MQKVTTVQDRTLQNCDYELVVSAGLSNGLGLSVVLDSGGQAGIQGELGEEVSDSDPSKKCRIQ